MKSTEKWGVDVETAVELALKDLKANRDEVEVEVLEESSSGFLGIGSKLAKVRVSIKEGAEETNEKATFDDIDALLAGLPENATQQLRRTEMKKDINKVDTSNMTDEEIDECSRSPARKRKEKRKEG